MTCTYALQECAVGCESSGFSQKQTDEQQGLFSIWMYRNARLLESKAAAAAYLLTILTSLLSSPEAGQCMQIHL